MLGIPTRDRRAERRAATKTEILDAAWEIVREEGFGGLNLRQLAQRLGMRAPSLYEYYPSKNAIHDAMFAQGFGQFDALVDEIEGAPELSELPRLARRSMEFMVADPARFALLFQRTIPGFRPCEASYAISIRVLDRMRRWFAAAGITDPAAVDLFTALMTGLASQQITNDPGGDRWTRLVDPAIAMFLAHVDPKRRTP